MSLSVVFRRIARREFDDAIDWYEQRRTGRGVIFSTTVRDLLVRIADQPHFYAEVEDGVRDARVRRHPYCVYYRVETDRIVILSVFHTSRDPTIWKERT